MTGEILNHTSISGNLQAEGSITGEVTLIEDVSGTIDLGTLVIERHALPYYQGEYVVTPNAYEQTLETNGKSMAGDVTVNPIPYFDVANVYGRTIVIGGD